MKPAWPLPLPAIALALVASIALVVIGLDPLAALAVFVLWVGSLYLLRSSPPESSGAQDRRNFDRESVGDLIEYSGTPLLLLEARRIVSANRAARKLLGAHIIGQDARVVFRHPETIELLTSSRPGTAIARGLVRRRDIWRINKQYIDDRLAVIELINRTAEADISRAHTDFVANASHELRTPLAAIIGYVETLSDNDEIAKVPKASEFLDTIMREARRLQNLVSDLMSLSRVEAEKHEEPIEIVELGPLVERAARDAAGLERDSRLRFAVEDGIRVRGDRQQLEQLTRNLVDNALKYGRSDGVVTVSLTREENGQARLTVRDEGEGIAPEHLPHLTRRFYRTDPGRSRATGGTGLGLAIVKHIVERHRGRLDIESKRSQGTQVHVTIPLLAQPGDEN